MKTFLALVLGVVGLSLSAQAVEAPPEPCWALRQCIRDGLFCAIVQLPAKRANLVTSEAYGDMVDRFQTLVRKNPKVHLLYVTQDLSKQLKGLPKSSRLRMVFVGKDGRALESASLYLDDPSPLVAFFEKTDAPSPLTDSPKDVLHLQLAEECH